MTTIIGKSATETLEGGPDDDMIEDRLGGADTLRGDGGNGFQDFISLQNTAATGFTTANLRDIPPDGSPVPLQTIVGTEDGETLNGTPGDDIISGLGGNDIINGNGGDDLLDGGDGDDELHGSGTLIGGAGNDWLDGDRTNTTASYAGATAGVTIDLRISTAQDTEGAGIDRLTGIANVIGSDFDDVFSPAGGPHFPAGPNIIIGGGGNDTLDLTDRGTFGVPVTIDLRLVGVVQNVDLYGSVALTGVESVIGSAQRNNILIGDGAANTLTGGNDVDRLYGMGGNDALHGGGGIDLLDGGDGDDLLDGGDGIDAASYAFATSGVNVSLLLQGVAQNTGGAGNDTLVNIENLTGSDFNDVLTGDDGGNTLTGGLGDDVLEGGGGDDRIDGGGGNDTASYAGAAAGVTVNLYSQVYGTFQNTVGAGLDLLVGIENLKGSAFDDVLAGDDGDNVIDGGAGNDTASYVGAAAGVTVSLLLQNAAQNTGGAGSDTLINIENLIGSNVDDFLTGDAGNNVITGGRGNDTIDGGDGIDTASYAGNDGPVSVDLRSFGPQDTGAGLDTLLNIENLIGSSYADALTGRSTDNVLQGGGGDDRLFGAAGNDTLDGGEGYDIAQFASTVAASQITFENGAIVVNGPDGRDVLTGIEQLLFTDGIVDVRYNGEAAGQARMELQGTDGADTLTGGQSWDSIFGNGGNDRLIGGEGNDFLDGGAGVDTAVYGGLFRSYQTSQTQVSGAITGTDTLVSIENQSFIDGQITYDENSNAAALYRLYDATLDRGPDSLGFLDWLRTLDAGTTLNQAAAAFVASPEFVNRYGNLSNQAFVEQLYAFTLNREGDAPGVAAWVGQLDAGTSRADVVLAFSESGEHRALSAPVLNAGIWIQDDQTMALARLYDATFDRLPDATGLENWRGALAGGTTLAQAAVAFAGSQEFQNAYGNLTNQTFVEQLYRFTLNREGDAQGIGDWVAYLDNGGSRSGLLLLFSESMEHIGLTQPLWERGITTVGTDLAATAAVTPLSGDLELLQAAHGIEDPGDALSPAFDILREAYDFHAHVNLQPAADWFVG